ncbi:MAG: trigger factor [Planctomycetia bacterium]|nr:trigger factor [Planctomycetia bacterium]
MTDETQAPTPITEEAPTATVEPPVEEAKNQKLTQAVEFKDVGPCKKHIKVTIERGAIDQKLQEKFKELVKDQEMVVAGFRPGKAPRKIVERRFRKDVTDQIKSEVLLQSLEQLAEEHDVAPLSPPNIDPTKIEIPNDGPMIYEFEVEVRPQFDLPNYRGLKLKRPVKTFTDADVTKELQRLLEPYGQLMPKPAASGQGEPTADDGDHVIVDITTKQGVRVLSTATEVKVRVSPKLAFKDGVAEKFGEQIKGAKAGETRNIDITLSDAVADDALRNQTVQASFLVKDVKTVQLPEITHELCHEFGVHSEEQLRELIRRVLDRRLEYEQRQAARRQVLAQIGAASQWDLPQDLLMRQSRNALRRRVTEMRAAGMSDEEINGQMRLLQQDVVSSTALALKEHFVLQKIAEVEKLEVNKDDIDSEIQRLAAQYDESPRRIRARLEKDDMMDSLEIELIERKSLDLVLANAEYEDVPLDQADGGGLATVEEQAVPGEMKDPTAAPAEDKPAEGQG